MFHQFICQPLSLETTAVSLCFAFLSVKKTPFLPQGLPGALKHFCSEFTTGFYFPHSGGAEL